MSRRNDNEIAPPEPCPLRPAMLRLGFALAVIASLAAFAVRAEAQPLSQDRGQSCHTPEGSRNLVVGGKDALQEIA